MSKTTLMWILALFVCYVIVNFWMFNSELPLFVKILIFGIECVAGLGMGWWRADRDYPISRGM